MATVDESGLVTAVGDGSCVITCRATDGSNVSNTCGVTVQTVDDSGYIDGHYYVDLQLPSREQFRELVNSQYTYSGWTTLNGVSVLKVKSKVNSNVIYLPAAGWINGTAVGFAGTQGTYWSRSSGMLNDFYFTQSSASMVSDTSYFGMPVRPVWKQ